MNCLLSSLSLAELIGWIITFIVGISGALLGAWLVLRNEKRKDIEKKRADVWELQPKLKIEARLENHPTMHIEILILNRGGSEAKNIKATMDGVSSTASLYELPPAQIPIPTPLPLNFSEKNEICRTKFDNPCVYISYHDKWFPDRLYQIKLPFKQKTLHPAPPDYTYMPDFEGTKQEPSWEQTAYSGYSDKEVLAIWNKEKLGR